MKKKILLIAVYLGKQPRWMDAYLRSCEKNPDVNWLLMVDWKELPKAPKNVKIKRITKKGLETLAKEITGARNILKNTYKICDYKPLYGILFQEDVRGYDFWGFTDLDLIHGNIRKFITEDVLDKYDVISASKYYCTGHFTLIRNSKKTNSLYKMNRYYKELFGNDVYAGFDELGLTEILKRKSVSKSIRWYHENINACTSDDRWFSSKVNEIANKEMKDYDFKNVAKWDRTKGTDLDASAYGPCIWDSGTLRHAESGKEVMYLHFSEWAAMNKPKICTDKWLIRNIGIMDMSRESIDKRVIIPQFGTYYIRRIWMAAVSLVKFSEMLAGKFGIVARRILGLPPAENLYGD